MVAYQLVRHVGGSHNAPYTYISFRVRVGRSSVMIIHSTKDSRLPCVKYIYIYIYTSRVGSTLLWIFFELKSAALYYLIAYLTYLKRRYATRYCLSAAVHNILPELILFYIATFI